MKQKVSILIPCFNAEKWIAQAIQSALDQTYHNKEVIVVDDGSTDRSLDVIKSFDQQIKYETGPNQGGNHTRNRLLELSTGEWVQYLDADDWLLPDKITRQWELRRDNRTDVIISPVFVQDINQPGVLKKIPFVAERKLIPMFFAWDMPQTGGALFRKEAIQKVGGWREDWRVCQDNALFLDLIKSNAHFEILEIYGAVYNQGIGGTVSTKDETNTNTQRLSLYKECLEWLDKNSKLTIAYKHLYLNAAVEVCRNIYSVNPKLGFKLFKQYSIPGSLHVGVRISRSYATLYNVLGFSNVQALSAVKNRVRRSIGMALAIKN